MAANRMAGLDLQLGGDLRPAPLGGVGAGGGEPGAAAAAYWGEKPVGRGALGRY